MSVSARGQKKPETEFEPQRLNPDSTAIIVVQSENLLGSELRWPLRIALLDCRKITMLVIVRGEPKRTSRRVDFEEIAELNSFRGVAESVRKGLDDCLGEGAWKAARPSGKADTAEPDVSDKTAEYDPTVDLWLISPDHVLEQTQRFVEDSQVDRILFLSSNDSTLEDERRKLLPAALRSFACPLTEVIPGERQETGELLLLAGSTIHGKAAAELADRLSAQTERRLTALYVEADIGPIASEVGERILKKRLSGVDRAAKAKLLRQRVVVNNDTFAGIQSVCREEAFEVAFLGTERSGALGMRTRKSVRKQLLKADTGLTVITTRGGLPIPSRLSLMLMNRVRNRIPQLDREERVGLVERIQSASDWDIDFVLLLALATVIATLGLIQDSPAIIIGAMLVAPLMTPLLGLALGVSQSNPYLVRMTLTTSSFGFVTVFGLALAIGLCSMNFQQATGEMLARHWPQNPDLLVAFASGVAAAYAYGRPGLLAALPGVAIATSLLPPIATSALAAAIGNFDLALGAMLLFGVNALAIVVAAAVTLQAMGLRQFAKTNFLTRWVRRSLLALASVTAIALALAPPLLAPPARTVSAIEAELSGQYRLHDVRVRRKLGQLTVNLELGGPRFPDEQLSRRLSEIIHTQLGEDVELWISFQHETLIP